MLTIVVGSGGIGCRQQRNFKLHWSYDYEDNDLLNLALTLDYFDKASTNRNLKIKSLKSYIDWTVLRVFRMFLMPMRGTPTPTYTSGGWEYLKSAIKGLKSKNAQGWF